MGRQAEDQPGQLRTLAVADMIPDATPAEHAARIRELARRSSRDIIEMGLRLRAVKDTLGHGQFTQWLREEFEWSEETARRMMRVAETFGQIGHIDRFGISAVYALTAGNVPERVRTEMVERAKAGEPISVKTVNAAIDAGSPVLRRTPPARWPGPRGVEVATMVPSPDGAGFEYEYRPETPEEAADYRLYEAARGADWNLDLVVERMGRTVGRTTANRLRVREHLAAHPATAELWQDLATKTLTLLYLLGEVGAVPSHTDAALVAGAETDTSDEGV